MGADHCSHVVRATAGLGHAGPVRAYLLDEGGFHAKQVKMLAQALREGTPNRNRIALQMVKDVLDESSFEASPGGFIPDKLGHAVAGVARKLRDKADPDHPK